MITFNIFRLKIRYLFVLFIVVISICLISFYSLGKKRYKILMIGLDGAGWNAMLPMIKEDKLPNIKQLMEDGSWGSLKIPMLPISEVVWTTIATGKPPHIHGITDNLIQNPDTNEMIPPTNNLRRVKAIWNILSDHKRKVGMVGYRVSWPAEKVNGVMISERANESSYSSTYYSEPPFSSLFTEERFNSFKRNRNPSTVFKSADWVFDNDLFMYNVSKYLLENKEFDFFCIYLQGIDVLSHYCLRHMFPEGQAVSIEDISKYKNIIKDYYIWCDGIIGDLLKIVDKNTIVIIVSDHGFKANYHKENKYFFSKFDKLLELTSLKKFNYNDKVVMLEEGPLTSRHVKYIKMTGDLTKKEFNTARENAKEILKNIKIKETGQPIFEILKNTDYGFVLKPNLESDKNIEYYNQNQTSHLLLNGQEHKITDFLTLDPNANGHDETDAIIIMSSKNTRLHPLLKDADVYDIVPTILYLLDLPVAADMQGKILVSSINSGLFNKKSARYIYTYEKYKKPVFQKPVRSPLDEKIIKDRMRSLGYIN